MGDPAHGVAPTGQMALLLAHKPPLENPLLVVILRAEHAVEIISNSACFYLLHRAHISNKYYL